MCAGFSSHTTSIRTNRELQKGGRRPIFKELDLTSSEARGNAPILDISGEIAIRAVAKKNRLELIQKVMVFLIFLGLWWYVYNL